MTLLPVIERELRSTARQSFTYSLRVIGVIGLLLVFALFGFRNSLRTPDLVEFGWTGAAQKLAADQFPDKWFLRP